MIFHSAPSTLVFGGMVDTAWTEFHWESIWRGWFKRGGGEVDTYIWYMFRGINTRCYWLLFYPHPPPHPSSLFLFWWRGFTWREGTWRRRTRSL